MPRTTPSTGRCSTCNDVVGKVGDASLGKALKGVSGGVVRAPQDNSVLLRLAPLLSSLEGGWCTALNEACRAVCSHLSCDHASVYVLRSETNYATAAACAGVGAEAVEGCPQSADPRFSGSAAAIISRLHGYHKGTPPQVLFYRSAPGAEPGPAAPSPLVSRAGSSGLISAGVASGMCATTLTPGLPSRGASGEESSGGMCGGPPALPGSGLPRAVTGGGFTPSTELPADWLALSEEFGLQHFAAVSAVSADGEPLGLLCVSSRSSTRPACWTPEALHAVTALLTPHIRRARAVLASAAMVGLHAAGTFSEAVEAVAEAARDVAAAVGYAKGQGRIAFIAADASAAAVFQPSPAERDPLATVPSLLKSQARRSSCEYVMMQPTLVMGGGSTPGTPAGGGTGGGGAAGAGAGSSQGGGAWPPSSLAAAGMRMALARGGSTANNTQSSMAQISMDEEAAALLHAGTGLTDAGTGEPLKRESWTAAALSARGAPSAVPSFTLRPGQGRKGAPCKGHTLPLAKTLLDEALAKQAAGLCIEDCRTHTLSNKAYPRDLVLSRGAVMPTSLALAIVYDSSQPFVRYQAPETSGNNSRQQGQQNDHSGSCPVATADLGRPLLAIYLTYDTTLPQQLLQAVVAELQQLLRAILPTIKAKLSGSLIHEYSCLCAHLADATGKKNGSFKSAAGAFMSSAQPTGALSSAATTHAELPLYTSPTAVTGGGYAMPGLDEHSPALRGGAGSPLQPHARVMSFMRGSEADAYRQAPARNGGLVSPLASAASQHPSPTLHAGSNAPLDTPCAATATAVSPFSTAGATSGSPTPTITTAATHTGMSPAPRLASLFHHLHPPPQRCVSNPALRNAGSGLPSLPEAPPQSWQGRGAAGGKGRAATTDVADFEADGTKADPDLEGDIDMEFMVQRGPASSVQLQGHRAMSGVGQHVLPYGCVDATSYNPRPQSATEAFAVAGAGANNRLIGRLGLGRSVSFYLEAAQTPRGASKLVPLISSMHERLKAAQTLQMTFARSDAAKADLASVKLLQEIGKGGYGTVYRGTFHGAEVAIKVIRQSKLAGTLGSAGNNIVSANLNLSKQQLHDAVELVASVSMSHTNIVQVPAFFMDVTLEGPDGNSLLDSANDLDPTDSKPFKLLRVNSILDSEAARAAGHAEGAMALVLEYCDCGSLCDAISTRRFIEKVTPKRGPGAAAGKTFFAINMRTVYTTLLEIALALRHMHAMHVVHCDLKPQNVLLKSSPRDPRGFVVKLSDFGLAKLMAADEEGQLVIDDTVASGTITHVAPEVLLGQKSITAAVDIYAFGILMFQMLCGMKVYDKMSATEIANQVAHRSMRPALPNWVPNSYRLLAQRCWSHAPTSRPTAEELVRHLEKAIETKH
ncbi:hypothetical protein HYH03_015206 [Edaphochlamys debaryana]|uniref:Protein kinase domain-containing protein n=1 Tax=Edaphochlamys debaryana TaxID=47281 RepID=A0A835XPW4_9CHLO|nr:hypothetical protein HYH03_015206 [Edaphochlamys debaryana]|eukprot:KAG2486111.1 hypothetical protein HYH03_015206 [Edaphochlamys debaryana]